MTRKDYVRIAAALAEQRENIEVTDYRRSEEAHKWFLAGWEVTARAIAEALKADNPRFDHDRFRRGGRVLTMSRTIRLAPGVSRVTADRIRAARKSFDRTRRNQRSRAR